MLITKETLIDIENKIGHNCWIVVSADEKGLIMQARAKDPETGNIFSHMRIFSFPEMHNLKYSGMLQNNFSREAKITFDRELKKHVVLPNLQS